MTHTDKVCSMIVSRIKEPPYIIGITGHIGEGKNYIAGELARNISANGFSVGILSLADPIKYILAIKHSIYKSKHHLYFGSNTYRSLIPDEIFDIANSLDCNDSREFMQKLGEKARELHPDIWVDIILKRIDYISNQIPVIIIPDIRFPNEVNKLRSTNRFFLIRVKRKLPLILESLQITKEAYEKMLDHESERYIDMLDVDLTIINHN